MNWYNKIKTSMIDKNAGSFQPIPILEDEVTNWVNGIYSLYKKLIDAIKTKRKMDNAKNSIEKLLYTEHFQEKKEELFLLAKQSGITVKQLQNIDTKPIEKQFDIDTTGWRYESLINESEFSYTDEFLKEFMKSRWSKITVEILHNPDFLVTGNTIHNHIQINFGVIHNEATLKDTCIHELSHVSQNYLKSKAKNKYVEYGHGPKSDKYISEEFKPSEFYPNINGLATQFLETISNFDLDSNQLKTALRIFVGADNPSDISFVLPNNLSINAEPSFLDLKINDNKLWQKAVNEFYKLVYLYL